MVTHWSRRSERAQDKESDRVESKGNEARRHGDGIIFLVASKLVDKKHFVTLKKLRENKNVDDKELINAFYSTKKATMV